MPMCGNTGRLFGVHLNERKNRSVANRTGVVSQLVQSADLKRKSTCWDLLKKTHENEDGTFVDARSHAINETMNARFDEASQPTIEEGLPQTPTTEAIDNIYMEVVGGVQQKRLYGIGSQAYVTFPDAMLGHADRAARTSSSAVAAATAEVAVVSSGCEALEKDNESLRQELDVLRQQ